MIETREEEFWNWMTHASGIVLTLIGNLLADIGYAWADPRVRKGLVK